MTTNCPAGIKKLLLLAIISFCSFAALAQSEYRTDKWRFSDPKQFGFTIIDVQFLSDNLGIAVGDAGGIARTTNGGTKWVYGPFNFTSPAGLKTTGTFYDVHFASPTVVYAVGTNGMMAKSIDAGANWTFVTTPLYNNSKAINTVWFVNKDTGYIAGQFNNTADSLPKIYRTRNGGASWDSISAPPSNGTTKAGYINNPTYGNVDLPITAKAKEIYRIQFINENVGYITGGGSSLFPALPFPNVSNATTCTPTSTTPLTTGSHNASLLWKFDNGVLTDYSISKERLGYTGYPSAAPFNCTAKFATVQQAIQQYRAFNIINDSTIVMMSFNNNIVLKVKTGRNDSTENINRPGVFEKGKYEVLNTGNAGPPFGYPVIPSIQVLTASNPYHMKRASNGKLYTSAGAGALWTSVDTGRTWVRERSIPSGRNYSGFGTWALDFTPSGRLFILGQGGVVSDSIPGGQLQSSYIFNGSGGEKIDFVDCNNGIITGGPAIAVTTNGGNSWINKDRADFLASFYSINGFHYTRLNRSYFAVSNGTIYTSPDQATTLDPLYSNFNYQMHDVVGFGMDTVYALGYSISSIPATSRKSTFFRSINGGVTWTTIDIASSTATPAYTAPTLRQMSFPSRQIGYVAGTRNGVYKTTDGGLTWTDISPFPALNFGPTGFSNSSVTYNEVFALNDNTVFLVGNMFTNTGVRRIYKSTDGGASWTDITGNIPALLPAGNMLGILFHDENNGYVTGGNVLFVTNDGGANWKMEIAPHGNISNTMGFAPRSVTGNVPFANRKLFLAGLSFGSGIPSIMEYGDTLNVNVNSSEVVANAVCSNLTAGSITINANGGIPPYTYSINGGPFQSSNIFTGLTQGVKTISVKDAYCGVLTKNVTVGFNDNLILTASNDTLVCAGAPVPLLASSNSTATTYLWTPATGLSATNIANPTATVNSNTAFTVTATLNGCSKSRTINIRIKPNPIVNAGPDKTIVEGDQILLQGSSGSTPASIAWTPTSGILSGANTFTPEVKPPVTTNYLMTVIDQNGCTSTDNALVTVLPYCLKVMNAFTPNGDGMNDRWIVTNNGGLCVKQVFVKVFNRYGNLVYRNDNYSNIWDGTFGGKPVPDGTYYYAIDYLLMNNNRVLLKGDVTILR